MNNQGQPTLQLTLGEQLFILSALTYSLIRSVNTHFIYCWPIHGGKYKKAWAFAGGFVEIRVIFTSTQDSLCQVVHSVWIPHNLVSRIKLRI